MKADIKVVLKTLFSAFLVSLVFALFAGFYVLGLLQGFKAGQTDAYRKVGVLLNAAQNRKQTSSTLNPNPTATPTPAAAVMKKKITWGGPDLWEAVNKRRKEFGVNPLNNASELCTIASIRLNELLNLGDLDGHKGFSDLEERRPDLKWIFEKYSNVFEFLAMGGETAEETVSLWENTLGHSKLLKGGEFVWGCIYAQDSFAVAITAF